jgi:hypothetical protein
MAFAHSLKPAPLSKRLKYAQRSRRASLGKINPERIENSISALHADDKLKHILGFDSIQISATITFIVASAAK